MSRALPLTALHIFVDVARRGSMKHAAQALCVSPGAISQQIKQLETRMGVQLFERANRTIKLSTAGRGLFDTIAHAFGEIEKAWDQSRGKQGDRAVVATHETRS